MRKQNVYLPLEDDTLITLDRLWEQMVEQERCAAITQAMRTLPDEDREIFYRFYDLSQTAGADRGGLTFERVDRAFAPDARTADTARGFGKRRSVL